MCAAGLDTGNYSIGQLSVEVKENKAVLSGTNTLAGRLVLCAHPPLYVNILDLGLL